MKALYGRSSRYAMIEKGRSFAMKGAQDFRYGGGSGLNKPGVYESRNLTYVKISAIVEVLGQICPRCVS